MACSARHSWVIEEGIEHDDGKDGDRFDRLADYRGDHRRHDQHADHEVGELSREHREHADRRYLRQQVWTVALQPVGGLERGKSLMTGCKLPNSGVRSDGVPRVGTGYDGWRRGGTGLHGVVAAVNSEGRGCRAVGR
jgi:hypothetical protein